VSELVRESHRGFGPKGGGEAGVGGGMPFGSRLSDHASAGLSLLGRIEVEHQRGHLCGGIGNIGMSGVGIVFYGIRAEMSRKSVWIAGESSTIKTRRLENSAS
jgi:hypothetical protein